MLSDILSFFLFGGAGQRTAMAATRAEICARHAISYFAVGKVPGDPFAFSSAREIQQFKSSQCGVTILLSSKDYGLHPPRSRAGVRARDQKSCGNLVSAGETQWGLLLSSRFFFFFFS